MIYEERYGFNPKTVFVIVMGGVFATAAIVMPDIDLVMRIGTVLMFGGYALLQLANSLSRKVALRVDRYGITLGGAPLRYRKGTRHFQWADIEDVVLWKHRATGNTWIGILRRTDGQSSSAAPTSSRVQARIPTAPTLTGAPDRHLLQGAKGVHGWTLDIAQLRAALQNIAPQVRLLDHQ